MTIETADIAVEAASIPDRVVAEIVEVVQRRHGMTDRAHIRDVAEREWARYQDARVRTFIPVLVRRAVVDQILAAPAPGDASNRNVRGVSGNERARRHPGG
jgi:hypothetical protein